MSEESVFGYMVLLTCPKIVARSLSDHVPE